MIAIGSRLEPLVDDYLIERMDGVSFRLHPPACPEVALRLDRPWEGPLSAYPAIISDERGHHLYYRGMPGARATACVCVADSEDGITWTRPSLGIVQFGGSANNNIILDNAGMAGSAGAHNFTPFLDTNPACPLGQRYKALAYGQSENAPQGKRATLVGYVSGDGVHWERLQGGEPLIVAPADFPHFDSQNVAFFDELRGDYVLYAREFVDGVRSVRSATSPDFMTWSDFEHGDFGDAPIEHLYTNSTVPFPGAEHIHIAFPKRFVPDRKVVEDWPAGGLSEACLMTTRDRVRWHRHLEAYIRPGPGREGWTERNFQVARGLIEAGDRIFLHWIEGYRSDAIRIVRGTVRREGFVSVNAPYAGGELLTRPLSFEGGELVINCSTSAAGGIRVEVQDESGAPIEGLSLDDCDLVYGDELQRPVTWGGSSDVSSLAGKPIRLRFAMSDADLYALRFRQAR